MEYSNFLKKVLPSDWIIAEELNADWDGVTTTAILKMQAGTDFVDGKSIPIQLVVLTSDALKTKAQLEEFIANNHNKYFIGDFGTYYKQYYYSPIVPVVATPTGNQLTNQVLMTGTLLASVGVSDIVGAEINGEAINVINCNIGLSTDAEAQSIIFAEGSGNLTKTRNKKGSLLIEMTTINKSNTFCKSLRNMRLGLENVNKTYTLTLLFTDEGIESPTQETYKVKVTNHSIGTDKMSLPTLKVVFAVGDD